MHKQNQDGSISVIVSIILTILLLGVGGFAFQAYTTGQDYKNNSDKKSAEAVAAAEKVQAEKLNAKFAEDYKNPNKTYIGPSAYGSLTFNYPKTWSAYVDESNPSSPINGYFYPDKVPGISTGSAFALRVEVTGGTYSQVAHQFDSAVKQGKVKAVAYVPPKMNGVANVQPGVRFDGTIAQNVSGPQKGAMVVIQLRDRVLKIYTLSDNFKADFDNIVLPNLSFVP